MDRGGLLESTLSDWPAHALNKESPRAGGNNEEVILDKPANPIRFFCEKRDWISGLPSSDNEGISVGSTRFPFASTASNGGVASGFTAAGSESSLRSSPSFGIWSGHHNWRESRCMIAGSSSMNKSRSFPSIVRWR